METLYRKFVKEWMEEQEIDTFIKDESGRVMYTSGGTTINLVHYFEELLEDFDEKLKTDNEELLERKKGYVQILQIVLDNPANNLSKYTIDLIGTLIRDLENTKKHKQ